MRRHLELRIILFIYYTMHSRETSWYQKPKFASIKVLNVNAIDFKFLLRVLTLHRNDRKKKMLRLENPPTR